MKFYFAGKISKNDWRGQLIYESIEFDPYDGTWEEKKISDTNHFYVGPYFIGCDHSCSHGPSRHGIIDSCLRDLEPDIARSEVVVFCLKAIDACDIFFAWLEPGAYGTLVELGYAKARQKKVVVAWDADLAEELQDLWFAHHVADETVVSPGLTPVDAFKQFVEKLDIVELTLDRCRSPIEIKYCEALKGKELFGFSVQQQYPVERYFLDFAFLHPNGRKVCVETDGHDFHERTKEQAQHDRERDRFLVLQGWRVLRFTGREIYLNVDRCINETLTHLRAEVQ